MRQVVESSGKKVRSLKRRVVESKGKSARGVWSWAHDKGCRCRGGDAPNCSIPGSWRMTSSGEDGPSLFRIKIGPFSRGV